MLDVDDVMLVDVNTLMSTISCSYIIRVVLREMLLIKALYKHSKPSIFTSFSLFPFNHDLMRIFHSFLSVVMEAL